jgi:hypothetical protein
MLKFFNVSENMAVAIFRVDVFWGGGEVGNSSHVDILDDPEDIIPEDAD